ncbi:hypothetical protein [Lacticaseibacillus nasuensis]|uniref:hypothetical protein n=1 Tax=Lacticaseibacillus nasuensis TaxID=944671 RepID=UPI002245F5E9|nr:hypothetical protein [Lacticaseibacillus nasuensis]MCX2455724.1 hypothetical protein [Lacticaseibacillus nasuensis]
MSELEWAIASAQAAADAATSYEDRAFYVALQDFLREQAHRVELAAGELDGRTWDHEAW